MISLMYGGGGVIDLVGWFLFGPPFGQAVASLSLTICLDQSQ